MGYHVWPRAAIGPSRRGPGVWSTRVESSCNPGAFGRRTICRRGFTLLELLAVVAIIGIILSLVLIAGMDAIRRSEERATQSLIAKLDAGVSDRLEALLQTRPDYNQTHLYLANVYYSTSASLPAITRAQVIAWYDYVKAEMPDVFVVQSDTNYPLNFAGAAMPGTDNSPNVLGGGPAVGFINQLVLPWVTPWSTIRRVVVTATAT